MASHIFQGAVVCRNVIAGAVTGAEAAAATCVIREFENFGFKKIEIFSSKISNLALFVY